MEMGAIAQGGIGQVLDSISALRAGVNLLLLNDKIELQQQIWAGLNQALDRGLLEKSVVEQSSQRVLALKKWLAGFEQPGLEVVGCLEHQKLAQQVAERSLTLVKDTAGLLPLRLKPQDKVLFIAPRPADLTPADTSSYLSHTLAAELHHYHPIVDELIISPEPTEAEIRTVLNHAAGYDFLILGSISASLYPAQAECFNQLLALGKPAVTIALRTPYDVLAYPQTSTHICTYNMHRPSMKALAAALFGKIPFTGQLPVQLEQLSVA
jgi:beta-N-acetylhexosaminidase